MTYTGHLGFHVNRKVDSGDFEKLTTLADVVHKIPDTQFHLKPLEHAHMTLLGSGAVRQAVRYNPDLGLYSDAELCDRLVQEFDGTDKQTVEVKTTGVEVMGNYKDVRVFGLTLDPTNPAIRHDFRTARTIFPETRSDPSYTPHVSIASFFLSSYSPRTHVALHQNRPETIRLTPVQYDAPKLPRHLPRQLR